MWLYFRLFLLALRLLRHNRRVWCSKTSSRHVPVVLMMQAAENRATDEPLRFGAP